MARTPAQIEQEILTYKDSAEELSVLNSLSNTAIWRFWVKLCSRIISTFESVFDAHTNDVQSRLDQQKAHRAKWYQELALNFQFGRDLIDDTDVYDNAELTDAEIEAEKLVKYATAKEVGNIVRIKIATNNNGEREPLSEDQEAAFIAYIKETKDAGVKFEITNKEADHFRASLDIYYDPMILDSLGNRLDGTVSEPVPTAAKDYIKNLPFNGEYTNKDLINNLEAVEGVIIPELKLAESYFGTNDWAPINAKITPDNGYFKIYDDIDLDITWIPYGADN